MGFCPCCTQAPHEAISPACAMGASDPLKQTGVRLWAEFGPWPPRRLAAIEYSMRYINAYPLPAGWDWAAKAPDFSSPEPIIRGIPGSEPIAAQRVAKAKASDAALPMPTSPMEQRIAGAVHAQSAVNPTLQPKHLASSPSPQPSNLPSDSSKQLNLPSTCPSALWEGRPLPVFREPYNKATSCDERDTAAPPVVAPLLAPTSFAKIIGGAYVA